MLSKCHDQTCFLAISSGTSVSAINHLPLILAFSLFLLIPVLELIQAMLHLQGKKADIQATKDRPFWSKSRPNVEFHS